METVDKLIEPLRRKLAEVGDRLSAERQAAAAKLKPLIERELGELGMVHAKFDVQLQRRGDVAASPTGLDEIEMLVQANPGQPPRPLRKVASGGELSRIMLAIKSVLAEVDEVPVLVFDEIDANIGGRIAATVGRKLRELGRHRQVLCVTHLPQIAACADHHVKVVKTMTGGQTSTRVEPLADRDSRIAELSEMLTGERQSEATRNQAQELLAIAAGIPRRKRLRLTG